MKHKSQFGSAHVIIIVILAVVILGLLMFVFWQNFINKPVASTANVQSSSSKDATSTQQKNDTPAAEVAPANARYESQKYTFEYPHQGWQATEDHYELNGQNYTTPVAKTSDWAQAGMAINAGASVSITTSTATQSLAAMKNSTASFSGGIARDLKDTKVDGVDAFSYRMSYEGERYYTVFIHGGVVYGIQYQYAYNSDANTHIDGYNMIVSTFRFK